MEKKLFRTEAGERTDQFERVLAFGAVALTHRGMSLMVPPDLDQELHEVLCARDTSGRGFEIFPLTHVREPQLGETVGKTMRQIDHPLAKNTIAILEQSGWAIGEEQYQTPACYLKVL